MEPADGCLTIMTATEILLALVSGGLIGVVLGLVGGGGSILAVAHRAIESLTLDREATHLKDSLMPRYAELVYYGFWFSPEREMLQALIDKSQEHVEGEVTLKLYKGNATVVGRSSRKSLYSDKMVTFEDDAGAYDQKDAEGFIKLNALRLRLLGKRGQE